MAGETVLITGGNGHIGYKVLVFALQAGYKVRAAVRSQAKADLILSGLSLKALNVGDRLSFVTVPDLVQPGAYDEALKGVEYAIHVASPITGGITEDKFQTHLLDPALKGTTNFLIAAKKNPSLRRVVITSSALAIQTWDEFFTTDTGKVFNEKSRTPDPTGPFGGEFEAYAASKIIALNYAEKWVKEEKPHFSLVHVHPSFVIGKDELVREASDATRGTNGAILGQVLGQKSPVALPGSTVYLDDTALAHVKALDESRVPDGQSLITNSGGLQGTTWGDAIDITNKHFSDAIKNGQIPNNGQTPTKRTTFDVSETEKLLGYGFKNYEDQVVSVVGHYLELLGAK